MTWDVTCARWAKMVRRVTPRAAEDTTGPNPDLSEARIPDSPAAAPGPGIADRRADDPSRRVCA